MLPIHRTRLFFFFNDTATTEIYTLSLHDALPILPQRRPFGPSVARKIEHVHRAENVARLIEAPDRVDVFVVADARGERCPRSEEHTSELQSQSNLVCRLLLEKKKNAQV